MRSSPNLKGNFCVVFTYSIKRACEIRKFHVAEVQLWQRNVQNSVMHVQFCCFFAVLLPTPSSSLVLFSSRNIAPMLTWHHTYPLYFFSLQVINTFLLYSKCLFVLKTPFLYIKFSTWTINYTFIKYLLLDNYVLHITLL